MGQFNVPSMLTANPSKPVCLVVGAIGATTSFLGILEKFHAKSNRRECKYDVQGFGEVIPERGCGVSCRLPSQNRTFLGSQRDFTCAISVYQASPGTGHPYQSSFRPNWTWRDVVDVLVITPAVGETPEGVKTTALGRLKFARLRRLNISARN